MKRVGLVLLLLVGLVLLPGAVVVPMPTIPVTAVLIFNRAAACAPGGGPDLYIQGFDLSGDGEGAEIILYGPIRPGGTFGPPIAWLFYDPTTGDLLYVILTRPNEPATRMSLDEVKALYPTPCDLITLGLRGV